MHEKIFYIILVNLEHLFIIIILLFQNILPLTYQPIAYKIRKVYVPRSMVVYYYFWRIHVNYLIHITFETDSCFEERLRLRPHIFG